MDAHEKLAISGPRDAPLLGGRLLVGQAGNVGAAMG